jgi:hypothetical protein
MKPFIFDPLNVNPTNKARRDYLDFFIEKSSEMAGDVKKVSTLDFKVKWLGYDDTCNLWLPWKDLREVIILRSYLRANNLNNLVPKQFKTPVWHLLKISASIHFFLFYVYVRTYECTIIFAVRCFSE